MNDINQLQIAIEPLFKELPGQVNVSLLSLASASISMPEGLFDSKTVNKGSIPDTSLTPYIAVSNTQGGFTLIDGCKRYCNSQKAGFVSALLIQTPLTDYTSGLLRIYLNTHRSFQIREKFLILTWLRKNCPADTLADTTLKSGITPRELEQLGILDNALEQVKEAVFNNVLDISLVPYLQVFSADDQLCFLSKFSNLRLSLQYQREFLEWLPEIAYRKNCTVTHLLEEQTIHQILNHTSLNAPQKIKKIHSLLFSLRFPELAETQKTWEHQIASYNPDPRCVSFESSPSFEKNRLTITISVTNAEQSIKIFKAFSQLSHNQWQKLIYPLAAQNEKSA